MSIQYSTYMQVAVTQLVCCHALTEEVDSLNMDRPLLVWSWSSEDSEIQFGARHRQGQQFAVLGVM